MNTPITAPLFYLDEATNTYRQVPATADTPALRQLIDFEAMIGGQEVTLRFRRLDTTERSE